MAEGQWKLRALLPEPEPSLRAILQRRPERVVVFSTTQRFRWAIHDGSRWRETSFYRHNDELRGVLHHTRIEEDKCSWCLFEGVVGPQVPAAAGRWSSNAVDFMSTTTTAAWATLGSEPVNLKRLHFRTADRIGGAVGTIPRALSDYSNLRFVITNGTTHEEFVTSSLTPVSDQWFADRLTPDLFVSLCDWNLMRPNELSSDTICRIGRLGRAMSVGAEFEYIDCLPARSVIRAFSKHEIWEWSGSDRFGLGTRCWIALREPDLIASVTPELLAAGALTPIGSVARLLDALCGSDEFPVGFTLGGTVGVIFSFDTIFSRDAG